ncbi:MAG TPA: methyltransferase domain-containing protein [Burkholderiaceae bacterium]|jgi:ubiquinone/menaquinone biosynthesis C-methylase UbiE|nr:methyltransferase domain-containing protein [Burkholderiaceae bacterium]
MDIHRVYQTLMKAFRFRERRMQMFVSAMQPAPTSRILDLGGTAFIWQYIGMQPQITLLNLDPQHDGIQYPPNIKYVVGNATRLPYRDGEFDIVFSNSVIEHVGDWEEISRFAAEARRVGRKLWVQTPAREFVIEPHVIAPLVHWLPRRAQVFLIRWFSVWGWVTRPSRERVEEFLDGTRLLRKSEFEQLFPDCEIRVERWFGLPKSFIAIRN